MDINQLAPQKLWTFFSALNAVPRPSKKEERVIEFMLKFGQSLNLETLRDEIGNVIIKKPATPGMEKCQTVILQSHLDMVHQKNANAIFELEKKIAAAQMSRDEMRDAYRTYNKFLVADLS